MEMCAEVLQLCPTLCEPMDCSWPGSSVMGFSREGYWSGLPFPFPGDLPHSGIKPVSLTAPALAVGFFTTSATWGNGNNPWKNIFQENNNNYYLEKGFLKIVL